ncbi:MAG: polyprenyl synthetase family protein [Saprospiraceae bacterium]|nr:polyprenyl synthetase family protein [Saprospiraceae bacterium]MCB0676163.1 polyprenyl synthetase family protein [Saprospiraceae bacterium]MCB0679764.1 polyprenyl synthetase family protein [Saprospiraceae bacterium]
MHAFQRFQQQFTTYLERHPFAGQPPALYEPVNYILSLGGKRLRPAVVLMACHLFHEEEEAALPAALAVEVFHNFTLVHDDIMDEAPLRRGQATVHQRYGLNAGILSGDVMLILAYEGLLQAYEAGQAADLLRVFNRVAREVCEGQQYDMSFESREDVSIPEYLRMIELKTAVLFGGALEMGAIVGRGGAENARQLYEFGRNAGIAFQLQDDILDTFGDPEKFGKKVGGDIVQNKKTYLVLKALEDGSDLQRDRLRHLLSIQPSDERAKVEEVRALFETLHIREKAEQVKADFRQKAHRHLEAVKAPSARKAVLQELADYLLGREE